MKLHYAKGSDGLYILSKANLDDIAMDALHEYMPHILTQPQALDIEYFIRECLNLDIRKRYISHSGEILGIMAFEDTEIPLPNKWFAHEEIVPSGTMLIEASLCEPQYRSRCRFTEAHEASHWILHRSYYTPKEGDYAFRRNLSYIACRKNTIVESPNLGIGLHSTEEWIEWQANTLAAALLMPKSTFLMACNDAMLCQSIKPYVPSQELSPRINAVIRIVSQRFAVSYAAVAIRMKQFGLL